MKKGTLTLTQMRKAYDKAVESDKRNTYKNAYGETLSIISKFKEIELPQKKWYEFWK